MSNQEWQPIETAPKNKMLWLHCDGLVLKGYWDEWDDPAGCWICREEPNDYNWKIEPTHWQPYYKPEPPK